MTGPHATPGDRPQPSGDVGSVTGSVVIGDVYQIQAAGTVTISTTRPPYRVAAMAGPSPRLPVEAARTQPSRLLLARHAVVPFTRRQTTLGDLSAWLSDAGTVAIRLLHGAGGQGKTRLADRFAQHAGAAGWQVWRVMHGAGPQVRMPLPHPAGGILAVVDYADRWPTADLAELIRHLQAVAVNVDVGIRILLLARSAGFWWSALAQTAGADSDVQADEQRLPPLDNADERAEHFAAARDAFAGAMGFEATGVEVPDMSADKAFSHVLTVHMAALVAVDAARDGTPAPPGPQGAATYLLERERAYWRELHAHGADPLSTGPRTMGRAVYTATLTGPVPREQARAALGEVGLARDSEKADQIVDDHLCCYPADADHLVFEPLHPDRLGEDFLALTLPGSPYRSAMVDDWCTNVPARLLTGSLQGRVLELPEYTPHAVTVLIEAARRWPHVAHGQLWPLLRAQPHLALAAGSAAMTRLLTLPEPDMAALEAVEATFVGGSDRGIEAGVAAVTQFVTRHRLAEVADPGQRARLQMTLGGRLADAGQWREALGAYAEAVTLYRRPAGASRTPGSGLARALRSQATALAALGDHTAALSITAEAVDLFRRIVVDDGTAWLPELAVTLTAYGMRLSELGRLGDALTATEEAVEIGRGVHAGDAEFAPNLASHLSSLGGRLADLGRLEEAVSTIRRAVDIMRQQIAVTDAGDLQGELAVALNNLGAGLVRLGRLDEALATMRELIEVRRRLAAANPAIFEAALGGSLSNLAGLLLRLGQWQASVEAAQKSVDILRPLARLNTARFGLDLARTVTNHAAALWQAGKHEQGLVAILEAVDTYHRLPVHLRDVSKPLLAVVRTNLGALLMEQQRHGEALTATTEAVSIFRSLSPETVAVHAADFALALTNQGNLEALQGRAEEACRTTAEAVAIYRRAAESNPGGHWAGLAQALNNQTANLSDLDRDAEALHVGLEAVDIYRRLALENEAAHLPDLAMSLGNLGAPLLSLNRADEAVDAAREAVDIYRHLSGDHPAAFEPALATALGNAAICMSVAGRNEEALAYSRDAVDLLEPRAHDDPDRFGSDLAEALLRFAKVRVRARAELPPARQAARRCVSWYEGTDARLAAGPLGLARQTLRDIDRLYRNLTGNGGDATATPPAVVADEVVQRFGAVGLARVQASLFAVDCQSCAEPIGAELPSLHVDDLGFTAVASLHHARCKPSAWNSADRNGLLTMRTRSGATTWTARCVTVPVADRGGTAQPCPMVLLNPSLEAVHLQRIADERWDVQVGFGFPDAGLVPPGQLQVGAAQDGVTAVVVDDCVQIWIAGASAAYSTPFPAAELPANPLGLDGFILAVTHALDPATLKSPEELIPVLRGDRTLLAWVTPQR